MTWLSFIEGMGSVLYFIAPPPKHPGEIYPDNNTDADWDKIGDDFTSALEKISGRYKG